MIKAIILTSMLLLTGCQTLQNSEESRLVRVVEYGVGADAIRAEGQVGGCKVETSDFPIEGNLIMTYDGDKCDVEYTRGY